MQSIATPMKPAKPAAPALAKGGTSRAKAPKAAARSATAGKTTAKGAGGAPKGGGTKGGEGGKSGGAKAGGGAKDAPSGKTPPKGPAKSAPAAEAKPAPARKSAAAATKPASKDSKPASKDSKPAAKDAKPASTAVKPASKDPKPATKEAKPAATKPRRPTKSGGEAEFAAKPPKALHYRMPAEWEPHFGTWLTWPNKKGISFPGKGAYEAVIPTLLSMIRALVTSEEVFINVSSEDDKAFLRDSLTLAEQRRVHLVDIPSMEPWCRDHGCTFVVRNHDKSGGAVIWKFNAWGGKYDKALTDAGISLKMAQFLGARLFDPGIILEGGSIDVNGSGSVLTTESCLLNKNRNRGKKREDIEKVLKESLNVSNILWLPGGIEGDDTDGHIDDIARFVNRNTVVTMVADDPKDKNKAILERNLEALKSMKIEDGTPLEVLTMTMPQPIVRKGQRLPASYANFYVGNKIVLLPTFDDPADEKALEVMVRAFPTRRIYPIDCRDLVWGLGAFHCLTQQVPLAAFPKVLDLIQNPPQPPRPVY